MADRGARRRLRVCHVITGFDTGGAERSLMQAVRRLDPARFESMVVSLRPRGPLSGEVEGLGVAVAHFGMGRRPGPITLARLAAHLRARRVDIAHAYLYDASLAVRAVGRVAGVPVVLTSTRASLGYLSPFAWRVDRLTARWCQRIIAVSKTTARFIVDVEGIAAPQVVVIPNGVDVNRFLPAPPGPARGALGLRDEQFVVACVGRLHPHKGHRDLFDALAQARSRIANLVCVIAGDGPDREFLVQRVRELGLGDVCRFLGVVDKIEAVYSACDVLVLPSHFEGMPNTVLEAMAMRRPVLATAVDGSVELVRPGETGLLVPPRDPPALADGLIALAGDATRRAALGARARAVVEEHHTIERSIGLLEALYEEEWSNAMRRRGR